MRALECLTSIVLLSTLFVACGSTDVDESKSADAGVESSADAETDTAIDCSRVGCAPPPLCSTGCTETCGCCSCGEGGQIPGEAGTLVCTGGCYAPAN